MHTTKSALIVGCGYVGTRLRAVLSASNWEVHGITRKTDSSQNLNINVTRPYKLNSHYQFVFYMISADSRTPSAYHQAYVQGVENTINALHEHNIKPHFVFISSTSLFAENLGATVTEESPIDTSSFSTKLIHEGEQLVCQSGFDYTVVRFSGIYGPQRCRLVDMVKSGTAKLKIKPYVSNRIHLDDCAGILEHLTRIDKPSQLYIASDCEPTPYNEVLEWIAKTTKAPSLKRETESSPQKHMSNKFCSNKKILATKYEFKHPNYRSGFLSCL